ncbi:MAG TPA: hypothetical protein VIW29_10935 [Polyangiaceae bacterium]
MSFTLSTEFRHSLVTFVTAGHNHEVMGKIIHFPIARIRQRRLPAPAAFHAFGELQLVERAQLKLLGCCLLGATLLTALLQLAAG